MYGPRRPPRNNSAEIDNATALSAKAVGDELFQDLRLPSLVSLDLCGFAVNREVAESFLGALPASVQSVQELGPFGVVYSPLKGFGEGLQNLILKLKRNGKLPRLQ